VKRWWNYCECTKDDVEMMLDDYRYDEDLDDESYIKKAKISRKKAVNEAKKFFNSQKEMYKMPLESSTAGVSQEEKEAIATEVLIDMVFSNDREQRPNDDKITS
jgi:tagatose-1,6-bisphosphate aldolase